MFKDKITVVIQGPMHPNSLVSLRALTRDFNVVISTWKINSRDEKNLDSLLERGDHVTVVSHNIEKLEFANNDANRFYQFYSTYRGFLLSDTEYVIKMRADEYYTNLVPFAEALLENPEKLITNDVFFRNPDSIEPESFHCHPSDHLYGGKKEILMRALELSMEDCKNLTNADLTTKFAKIRNKNYHIVPEQHFFANFVLSKNPDYIFSLEKATKNLNEELKELVKENCHVVPCEELGFYCVSFTNNYSFYPREDYFNPRKDLKKL